MQRSPLNARQQKRAFGNAVTAQKGFGVFMPFINLPIWQWLVSCKMQAFGLISGCISRHMRKGRNEVAFLVRIYKILGYATKYISAGQFISVFRMSSNPRSKDRPLRR